MQRAEKMVLNVPPGANYVPLEIRVCLVSQRPVTAFWHGRKVLCHNKQGYVIPTQQLGTRIASFNQQEIHCSVGPVQINQQTYLGMYRCSKTSVIGFP